VRIVHFGQSCVLVEIGTARLLLDPGIYSAGFDDLTGLDAILVTHQHPDHLDLARMPALLAANPAAQLHVDAGSAPQLTSAGIAHQVVSPGQQLQLAGTAVEVVGGDHGVIHPDIPVVPNNGYLIAGDTGTVLHPGDSFTVPACDIDLLLLPTAAPWLKVAEAVDYLRAIAPPLAVPIHQAILATPEKYYGLFRELAPAGGLIPCRELAEAWATAWQAAWWELPLNLVEPGAAGRALVAQSAVVVPVVGPGGRVVDAVVVVGVDAVIPRVTVPSTAAKVRVTVTATSAVGG
jgi:L-ascorbate metabolism protein UlaG (beta-lactamase superfamily)